MKQRLGGIRHLRVANAIKEALSSIILHSDVLPYVMGCAMFTITHVRVTRDLRVVQVMISCGSDEETRLMLEILKNRTKVLLYEVLQRVNLRYAPALYFKAQVKDSSMEYGRLERLLDTIT